MDEHGSFNHIMYELVQDTKQVVKHGAKIVIPAAIGAHYAPRITERLIYYGHSIMSSLLSGIEGCSLLQPLNDAFFQIANRINYSSRIPIEVGGAMVGVYLAYGPVRNAYLRLSNSLKRNNPLIKEKVPVKKEIQAESLDAKVSAEVAKQFETNPVINRRINAAVRKATGSRRKK